MRSLSHIHAPAVRQGAGRRPDPRAPLQHKANRSAPVQRLQGMQARANRKAPVQRRPILGDDAAPSDADLVDFLSSHGHHIFAGFTAKIQRGGTSKDNAFDLIDKTYDRTAEGAGQLAADAIAQLGEGFGQADGTQQSQQKVMRKLAEITELVRVTRFNLAHDRDAAVDLAQELYHNAGLCFGFTEIFKKHATWETALWNAIASWVPPEGETKPFAILEAFNSHLEGAINWASGEKDDRALEAVVLLKEAWVAMEAQGEDPTYGALPGWMAGVSGTAAETKLVKVGQMTRVIQAPHVQDRGDIRNEVSKTAQSDLEVEVRLTHAAEIAQLQGKLDKVKATEVGKDTLSEDVGGLSTPQEKALVERINSLKTQYKGKAKVLANVLKRAPNNIIKGMIDEYVAGLVQERLDAPDQQLQIDHTTDVEHGAQSRAHSQQTVAFMVQAGAQVRAHHETQCVPIMLEISTSGHSMSAQYTDGQIMALEPEIFGAAQFDDWAAFGQALSQSVSVGFRSDDAKSGIAVDLEISEVRPGKAGGEATSAVAGSGVSRQEGRNILEVLEPESIASFRRLEQEKGKGGQDGFMRSVNKDLAKKIA